jgi:DNA primase
MENAALLILLESVLGKSHRTSRGNHSFKCPFPNCPSHLKQDKNKLEINLVTNAKNENPWHCWVCESKGKTIKTLFKQIKAPVDKFNELKMVITPTDGDTHYYPSSTTLTLPKEFISLIDISKLDKITSLEAKRALAFLRKRGVNHEDIIKYNIGFCQEGSYKDRVIIPSYDGYGNINYFIARAFIEGIQKYKNPPVDAKSAIGWELLINWDAPIILIEGVFDALTVKRNVIPLFGKRIHDKLMQKLVQSSVNRIYIALDPDAIKNALKYAEELMSYGKEVYLVEITGKDANEIGFESFLKTIENTVPLNFQSLLNRKLEL